jgi:negative regulator of flagellin synthesis FlgM
MTDKLTIPGGSGLDITQSRARAVDATQQGKAAESTQRPDAARDDVKLTDTATNLKRIEARLAEIPEIDQSRVDEIRQRLQSDSYEIDPEQLAQKMLRLDQDLS